MFVRAVLAALGTLVLFAAVTLAALEGREVVVLRTWDAAGVARETRTWVADEDGYAWIEAANAERPFLVQLAARPELAMRRGGRTYRCAAARMPDPDGHLRIRRLLAAKYAWADRWIGLLADTQHSVAVRLACAPDERRP